MRAAASLAAIVVTSAGLWTAVTDAHDPPRTKVTWTGDIERIVRARCIRCHAPDGKGPMSLVTYEDARPWARAIREEVMARRMPKWHAARGYGRFLNDPSLSPFEIALFVAWVDGGALRGGSTNPSVTAGTPFQPLPSVGPAPRFVTLPCSARRIPAGRLLAITPELPEHSSAGFEVRLADGRREIVAWIRNYESNFQETYWLERPLEIPPGARLSVETTARCSVMLHMAE